jgi:ethanolamine permease
VRTTSRSAASGGTPGCGRSGARVGAVISGEYYGWNFGLGTGGFGGLLIAGVLMAIMYYGLVYSIAEMSPALPHTGGAYSFARRRWARGGVPHRLAENMEYVITPAVVVGAMAC